MRVTSTTTNYFDPEEDKMATCSSSRSLNQTNKANEDDMLCTICLSLKKDPRLLPCLHSYCKGCLDTILSKPVRKSTSTLSCPQCRIKHAIPREGASGFPQDQVLANAIKVHIAKTPGEKSQTETTKTVRQCTMCTEDDPATSFCSTCGKFLCDFCHKAHKRLVDFRDHKYTPLSEIDQVDKLAATAELPSYCTLHSGEVLKLYCKTCQKVICRDCTIVTHRSHEYGFINELRPQVQQGIETTIARLKAKQKEFQAHLTFLKDLETSRNAHATTIENEITAAFNSYIEALKTRQAELLSIEQGSKEADLKQIWAQKQHVETMLANLSSAVRYAERLCACPSDKVMLAMQGETTSRLNSLQCTTWNASDIREISVPNTFAETELKLSEAGILEPESSLSVSMRAERPQPQATQTAVNFVPAPAQQLQFGQQFIGQQFSQQFSQQFGQRQHVPDPQLFGGRKVVAEKSFVLGETIHYIIDINGTNPKPNCIIIPSISITSGSAGGPPITYTICYHGDGVWSLSYRPPYCGRFTTKVSIDAGIPAKHSSSRHTRTATKSKQSATKSLYQKPVTQTVTHTINVRGSLKVGDLVCRGPHWRGGDEDGGVGGVGTVTEIPTGREMPRAFECSVKWENGRTGTYKAQEGREFEIELAPNEPAQEK